MPVISISIVVISLCLPFGRVLLLFSPFGFVHEILGNISSCHPENVDFAALFHSRRARPNAVAAQAISSSSSSAATTTPARTVFLAVWHFEGTIGIFHNKLTRLTKLS